MKKITLFIISFFLIFNSSVSNAYFDEYADYDYIITSIEELIDSPSLMDLVFIEDEEVRYCEEVYLEAYRRREFTSEENGRCGGLFATKMEEEMNYMRYMQNNRGLFN